MFIIVQHNCKKSNVPKHSTKNSNIYVDGQMPYVFLLTGCQNNNTKCNVKIGPYFNHKTSRSFCVVLLLKKDMGEIIYKVCY